MKIKANLPSNINGEVQFSPKDVKALHNIFHTPEVIKQSIGIFEDNIKYLRWKNLVKISVNAESFLKENNIKEKQLPVKFEVPFIEYASLQEEITIQQLWTNLLINAASGKIDPNNIFISILNDLNIVEVEILNMFYSEIYKDNFTNPDEIVIPLHTLKEGLKKKYTKIEVAIDNLFRLKLIENPPITHSSLSYTFTSIHHQNTNISSYQDMEELKRYLERERDAEEDAKGRIKLTSLGYELIRSCNISEDKK